MAEASGRTSTGGGLLHQSSEELLEELHPSASRDQYGSVTTSAYLICVWNTGGDDGDACAVKCECAAAIHVSG